MTINSHFSGGFVLMLVLSGLALGAALSDRWWHLFRRNFAVALAAALLAGCFGLAMQSGLFWAAFGGLRYQPYQIGSLKYFLQTVGPGLLCVVVPFTFAGLIFPLLFKHVEDSANLPLEWVFAFNGLGGWVGAEIAQSVLLPRFGLWGAACFVAAGYAVLISILPLRRTWRFGASGGALIFCAGAWGAFSGLPQVQPGSAQRIRAVGIGREGVVAVAEGEPDDWRIIFNNSHTLGGSRAATNQERQALLPILLHGEAKRVATLGVATGSTASGGPLASGCRKAGRHRTLSARGEVCRTVLWPIQSQSFHRSTRPGGACRCPLRGPSKAGGLRRDCRRPVSSLAHWRGAFVYPRTLPSSAARVAARRTLLPVASHVPAHRKTVRGHRPDVQRGFSGCVHRAWRLLCRQRDRRTNRWAGPRRYPLGCRRTSVFHDSRGKESRDPLARHVEGVSMLVVGPLPSRPDVPINTLDDGWLEWDGRPQHH